MLEIRLNTLNNVVDKFVLVEATRTQNNKKKPLYYEKNKKRFKKFEDKIIHIVVDKYPKKINKWTIENHQRNQIKKGLRKCKSDDIIMVSDLDEIVNPELIKKHKSCLEKGTITVFNLHTFFLYLNLWYPYLLCDNRVKMYFYEDFKKGILNDEEVNHCGLEKMINKKTTFSKIRLYKGEKQKFVENAGWHFTWLGDEKKTLKKLRAVCEGRKKATIEDAIKHRNRFFAKLKPVVINEHFPKYIRENQKKYEHLLGRQKYRYSPQVMRLYTIQRKIHKFILRLINCFIPSKKLRYRVRHSLDL